VEENPVPQETADIRVLITSPASATHDSDFTPMAHVYPNEILFVAFFKTAELRADLLARLREAAKEPIAAEGDREAAAVDIGREFTTQWKAGNTAEALVIAVRWWSNVKRLPYHAYSLKAGVGPYVTSCLVAFDAPDTVTMRFNLARAVDVLERERSRVMDFFGWEGTTEGF